MKYHNTLRLCAFAFKNRWLVRAAALVAALLLICATWSYTANAQSFRVLVFHRTVAPAFRHNSIDEGIAAIQTLGADHGFAVDVTQDAGAFTASNLANYRVLIFLSTTGDILNSNSTGSA